MTIGGAEQILIKRIMQWFSDGPDDPSCSDCGTRPESIGGICGRCAAREAMLGYEHLPNYSSDSDPKPDWGRKKCIECGNFVLDLKGMDYCNKCGAEWHWPADLIEEGWELVYT